MTMAVQELADGLVQRVTADALRGLKKRDAQVVEMQCEPGLTIYQLKIAGYIPMYVRFETHLGRIKTDQEAKEDWQKHHKGFLKRCERMMATGDIRIEPLSAYPMFDEHDEQGNIWTQNRQLYCFTQLTPLLALRIPFDVKEA